MPVKNIIPGQHVTKEKLQRSRELRREMTPAEKVLWEELRGSKLGVRFRRQQAIQGFIVDFYCHQAGLVIEVDGDVHDLQKGEDERQEKVLTPSVRWTSPPNATRKTWDENEEFESSDLGETRRWALCYTLTVYAQP